MSTYSEEALLGEWVHSHEEDTEDEMVFRPATYEFPLSRGRISFDLLPGGIYVESSPGPVDLPVETRGHWALEGNRLILEGEGDQPGYAWEIAAVEGDRLVVKEPH